MEFGQLPLVIAPERTAKELEELYQEKKLAATDNPFTYDAEPLDAYDNPFKPENSPEYLHNGKGWRRFIARPYDSDSILSNDRRVEKGEVCWLGNAPVRWLVDPSGWWVAHVGLVAGVQFDIKYPYKGNFAKTNMHRYLGNYLLPEMRANPLEANGNAGLWQQIEMAKDTVVHLETALSQSRQTLAALEEMARNQSR